MELKVPSANATIMQNACYFVHLANATYLADPENYPYFGEFQFEQFKIIESNDGINVAIAARIDGALIVAIRGSDDAQDWWSNFHFRKTPDYDGEVHEGFYGSANSLWKPISQFLWRNWRQGDAVWLAGHSLGGALATLTSKWLRHEDYEIAGVYTFGQPRVGDNTFAEKYPVADGHYRFVNHKDIVPQVPYRWMGPGMYYEHVGKLYHFDKNGKLERSDKAWNELVEDFAQNILIRRPGWAKPDFGFADHGIQNYILRIEAALN